MPQSLGLYEDLTVAENLAFSAAAYGSSQAVLQGELADQGLKATFMGGDGITDDEFAAFLEEYEQRHNGDRQRLDAMMLFGQITTCRMRYLLDYFGEDSESDCSRCDNCRAGQEGAESNFKDVALSAGAIQPATSSDAVGAAVAANS